MYKKSIVRLKLLFLISLFIFTQQLLANPSAVNCNIIARPITSSCSSDEVYAGVKKVKRHGGTCLKAVGQCSFLAYQTMSKSCSAKFIYLGPNKAEEHGGSCVSLTSYNGNPIFLKARYIANDFEKSCNGDGVYVGPVKVSEHGGFCLSKQNNTTSNYVPQQNKPTSNYVPQQNRPTSNYVPKQNKPKTGDLYTELNKLGDLRDRGLLTNEEYYQLKNNLLKNQ
jgi:hypothetical protein